MRSVRTLFALGLLVASVLSLSGAHAGAQPVTVTGGAPTEGPLDPSATASAPTETPSATPTLEYEIDVPVSFFPSEMPYGESEDSATPTATATRTTIPAATENASGDDGVTSLPTAGVAGPSKGRQGWALAAALLAVLGSSLLVLRVRNAPRA